MALRRILRLLSATNPFPINTTPPPPPPRHTEFMAGRAGMTNYSSPSFLTLPVGKKLREKVNSIGRPHPEVFGMGPADAKRVLKLVKMEQIREKLRNIPATAIPYGQFERICGDACGNTRMSLEFANLLDQSGYVIVLGGIVFLRPDQVAKSMEGLISELIEMPNDPRRKELDNLEIQKAHIDEKARSLVRGELYCGLGFIVVQTLGFMRLTFWELSWDVMEPICFFVTSLHFALAYAFFLRTSNEPSFEGYFRTRFQLKQQKLMNAHNFDVRRYNQLREVLCANHGMSKNMRHDGRLHS